MSDIKIYTKKRCPHCVSAKAWLKQRNYIYEEISLDEPSNVKAFLLEYPELKTVPQIFEGDEHIGGFSDLLKSRLGSR
jgi:glutaredoxin 3